MTIPPFFSGQLRSRIVIPILVSILFNVILYLLLRPDSTSIIQPLAGSFWGIMEFVIIALFASAPLFYGWFTRRPSESAVFGMFLTTFLYIPGFIDVIHYPGIKEVLSGLGLYGASVLCLGGAGYLAARGVLRELIIAALFVVLWLFILFSGLN